MNVVEVLNFFFMLGSLELGMVCKCIDKLA